METHKEPNVKDWSPLIDPTFRRGQCRFYTWPVSDGIPVLDEAAIQLEDTATKQFLFRKLLPTHREQINQGHETLNRLHTLYPLASGLFESKPYLVDSLTLRMYSGETTDPAKSYTALSYCWPETANAGSSSKTSSTATTAAAPEKLLPIHVLLFQHLVLQRETADEGIWCDQICIDQSNEAEKAVAVSAMDAIYACARVVVVAIEDVVVTPEEQRFFRHFIEDYEDPKYDALTPPHVFEKPPYMATHPILKEFYVKLLGARWFGRAWCSHEMHMAKHHCFILRCEDTPDRRNTLLSMSDFFLSYLVLLSGSVSMETDQLKYARDTMHRVFNYNRYMHRMRSIITSDGEEEVFDIVTKVDTSSKLAPYTRQISEVFSLGAGGNPAAIDRARDADLDRITIVLNTLNTGLALRRHDAVQSPLTSSGEQCQRLLLLLGLAAGDVTALCTRGPPFRWPSTASQGPTSWLQQPHYSDVGSGAFRQEALPRISPEDLANISVDESVSLRWIRMDMWLPGSFIMPDAGLRHVADYMVKACRQTGLGGGFLGNMALGPEYGGWRQEADLEQWNVNFVGVIACFLQLGPRWLCGMMTRCGFASPDLQETFKSRLRAYFGDTIDQEGPFDGDLLLRGEVWSETSEGRLAVDTILRVAFWAISFSMLFMWRTAPERELWRPWLISGGGGAGDDDEKQPIGLVVAPAATTPAIPAALFSDAFAFQRLPRVWLLDQLGEQNQLVGKSFLFANWVEGDCEKLSKTWKKERMQVYGKED